MRALEEGERAGEASGDSDENDGDEEATIFAEVFAIAGDGGELARPQGDGVGSVGLDGQKSGLNQRGKDEESATAGDRVDEAAEPGCQSQEDVVEPGDVHLIRLQVTGYRAQGSGLN